jgi:hypothetical protein
MMKVFTRPTSASDCFLKFRLLTFRWKVKNEETKEETKEETMKFVKRKSNVLYQKWTIIFFMNTQEKSKKKD